MRDDNREAGGEPPCLLTLLDEQGRVPDPPSGVAQRIYTKRVYDPAAPTDGYRVLVDRLWPRGLPKEAARIDLWLRAVAPSNDLRRWFGHDPERWEEFCQRYQRELDAPERGILLGDLAAHALRGPLTLLYGARDAEHNNALVLRAALLSALGREEPLHGRSTCVSGV